MATDPKYCPDCGKLLAVLTTYYGIKHFICDNHRVIDRIIPPDMTINYISGTCPECNKMIQPTIEEFDGNFYKIYTCKDHKTFFIDNHDTIGKVVYNKNYPNKCPKCNNPAYLGFNMIDCSNKGCK